MVCKSMMGWAWVGRRWAKARARVGARKVVARSKELRGPVGLAHSRWEVFLGRLRCRQTLHAMARQVVNI